LEVDNREEAKTVDEDGRVWRDYVITKPEPMSRVFGPLARVKLYESKDENSNWEIDFSKPRHEVWEYMAQKYLGFTNDYGFDFMRGDMSHVQMNPDVNYLQSDVYYDIHKYIKQSIQQQKPSFGYFAESFLAPPNTMAYGVEEDHLEASDTDTTLGDLQSMIVGTETFISSFSRYHQLIKTRKFAPNFTIMTADKDDPRFDSFYLKGNEIRMFMGIFLTDMPSYMALGFEQRDPHPQPAPNEHYTKLYVFQLSEGKNATHGKYEWGQNAELFQNLTTLKNIAEKINESIENQAIEWLIEPDILGKKKVIAWTQKENPKYVFIVNLDTEQAIESSELQSILQKKKVSNYYTNDPKNSFSNEVLGVGECRIYEFQ
jgi:hypothetical protein